MSAAVPNFVDAYDTSLPVPPFANAFEGDAWVDAWCGTCQHSTEGADGCSLVDVARLDRLPAEWIELDRGSLRNRYMCLSWAPAAGYVNLVEMIRAADIPGINDGDDT